jgi:hypothetical protein
MATINQALRTPLGSAQRVPSLDVLLVEDSQVLTERFTEALNYCIVAESRPGLQSNKGQSR